METPAMREEAVFLTTRQCAERLQTSKWAIYHWISAGKLGTAQGLRRIGSRGIIDRHVLKAAIERGDLG
jgi:predicted DNA-binding transcriptional regulator AlpA